MSSRTLVRADWAQVLISPLHGRLDQVRKSPAREATRKQFGGEPSIDAQPYRDIEEEYHQVLWWPAYWQGRVCGGMSGFPVGALLSISPDQLPPPAVSNPDPNGLCSTQAVNVPYQASDGMIATSRLYDGRPKAVAIGQLSKSAPLFPARRAAIDNCGAILRGFHGDRDLTCEAVEHGAGRTPVGGRSAGQIENQY